MNTVVKKSSPFSQQQSDPCGHRILALARRRGLRWREILRQAQGRLFRRYPAGVDLARHQRSNRSAAPRWATLAASPNINVSIIGIFSSFVTANSFCEGIFSSICASLFD